MPTPKSAPEWLSPADAAALLGVKPRQLQERATQGYIERRRLPRAPTEKTARVEFLRADIEALKRGTPNVHATAVREDAASNDTGKELATNGQRIGNGKPTTALATRPAAAVGGGELAHLMNYFAAAFPPAPRPWLALAEAAEYSGLPAAYLVAQARSGAIRAVNVGTGAREFWRFNREGLGK